MAKFKFTVEETYTVVYEVEADSKDEAYTMLDEALSEGQCSPINDGSVFGDYDCQIHSAPKDAGPCVDFETAIQDN